MYTVIRKTYLLLLAIVTLSLVMIVGAQTAEAIPNYDIDRKLRVYYQGSNQSYGPGYPMPRDANRAVVEYAGLVGRSHRDGNWAVADYNYNLRYGGWNLWIVYDVREMRNRGFTREGRITVRQHERAHTRGWDHGQGSYYRNRAFCPKQNKYGAEFYGNRTRCP